MISWEEYLRSNILDFRQSYKELSKEYRESIEANKETSLASLIKPSQVVVIDFNKPYPTFFIILHTEDYPDKETIVYENVRFEGFFPKLSKEKPRLHGLLGNEVIDYIQDKSVKLAGLPVTIDFEAFDKSYVLIDSGELRTGWRFSSLLYAIIDSSLEKEKRKRIEETVKDIKKDASAIDETELRIRIIEKTERLENQTKQLDKKLRKEIGRVRKLIGTSEKYLDWRAFSADVEHLKETHITKGTFDAHIKRLDDKIDTLKENLNTRIEDLKAIKFWSKRTLLEIALAIMTVIAALYGAGVIKF